MANMNSPEVRSLPRTRVPVGRNGDQRLRMRSRAAQQERRRLARMGEAPAASAGRAWINGREVGGADPRFAHLAGSYD